MKLKYDKRHLIIKGKEGKDYRCNNKTIFQNELFSSFLPSTYVAWQRRSLCDAA